MKNIEKYTNTKAALDAYNSLDFKRVPFDVWLECEYEEPRAPTLLEAAEAVKNTWYSHGPDGSLSRLETTIIHLADAIAIERRKPVRNFDRFATADEAAEAYECFRKFCSKVSCSECRFFGRGIPCVLAWLYTEAEKEAAE
jgi:hypothetical protein